MSIMTKKRYTTEFKAQALELVELGKPVAQVAQELEIRPDLIYRWRREGVQLGRSSEAPASVVEKSEGSEVRALRRENASLKLENDILKKAAVILGTKPRLNSGK